MTGRRTSTVRIGQSQTERRAARRRRNRECGHRRWNRAHRRTQGPAGATRLRARVVGVATDDRTVEVTGDSGKVQALLPVLEPFGINLVAQSGLLAMGRGSKSITDRVFRTA